MGAELGACCGPLFVCLMWVAFCADNMPAHYITCSDSERYPTLHTYLSKLCKPSGLCVRHIAAQKCWQAWATSLLYMATA